jgi:hypothetical protein
MRSRTKSSLGRNGLCDKTQKSHVGPSYDTVARMNIMLLKGLTALVPTCMLLFGAAALSFRAKAPYAFLQLLGAACLAAVVLAHVCEALDLFAWVRWGDEHSVGHYLDLVSAVVGGTLFPIGYLLYALTPR